MVRPIEYPEIGRIIYTYQPQRFLGKELVWEAKEDGSNVMIWLNEYNQLCISSRHMEDAERRLKETWLGTPQAHPTEYLLREMFLEYGKKIVIFQELRRKGKSPTKLKDYPDDSAILFDIYSLDDGKWLNYTGKYQLCYHYKIPIVEALATCVCKEISGLTEFATVVLDICKERGYEGAVVKVQNGETLFAKEKLDTPKLENLPRREDDGLVIYPMIPESEIGGTFEKVYVDLGQAIFDKTIAMPLFAKYLSEEAKKHLYCLPNNLFSIYIRKLQELNL